MTHYRLILTSVLILMGSCLGQEKERGGTDPTVAVPLLKRILGTAQLSGSIAYWGRCELRKPYPDFPALSYPSNNSRSPSELLREVFAKDSKMEVTQESNGRIRMFETDVPMDLLDIEIHHVSFGPPDEDRGIFNGPNDALYTILSSREVKTYRKSHRIGPFAEERAGPHPSAHKRQVSGDLYDVTVKQALDYVLQTFPGFWFYENCESNERELGRNVNFGFYEADTPRADKSLDEKSK